ncbi:MAG TPA: SpoIIE family protein phosphatase [Nitrospiraceae bacterium]|nr:SpoIIE family protein phosphatase [Nitrospiraceae bacterium]
MPAFDFPPTQADSPVARPSILLVDDDAVTRARMSARLQKFGCDVIEADDGEAGLNAARAHRPNLIILDWIMPGLDGPSVCEAIRADAGLKSCQIVLLTAHDEPDQIAEGLARGADDFLSKAATKQEIMARVQANLRANALVRELERTRDRLDRSNRQLSSKQQELESELQSAADFVSSLLPSRKSSFPGLTMAWAYHPSLALGGDLFQISRWGSRTLGIAILDASGHGVAAALRAVGLSSFLREDNLATFSGSFDPGTIVTQANRLFPLSDDGEYFTLWVGRLDLDTWSLTFAAAGHSGALVQREDGCEWLTNETLPLGFEPDTEFASRDIVLRPSDRLVLCSDGIYEAPSPHGELWGRERLANQLIANRRRSLADCLSRTIETARDWHGSDHFPDDVALLALEIGQASSSLKENIMQAESAFNLAAALEQIDGDRELFAALAGLFMSQAKMDMAGIQEALAQGNSQELMKRAHRLKGSAMQFHATGLHETTKRLEELARQGAMADAAAVVQLVEERLAGLTEALQEALKT